MILVAYASLMLWPMALAWLDSEDIEAATEPA